MQTLWWKQMPHLLFFLSHVRSWTDIQTLGLSGILQYEFIIIDDTEADSSKEKLIYINQAQHEIYYWQKTSKGSNGF